MGRMLGKRLPRVESREQLGFIFCAAGFLLGALCGAIAAGYVSGDDALYLSEWLFSDISGLAAAPSFGSALVRAFSYHAAVFLLAFSVPGFVLIPVITALKGFFLAFASASAVSAVSAMPALFAFGLPALVAVPTLLFVSSQSFAASVSMASAYLSGSSMRGLCGKSFFIRCVLCVPALFILVFLDMYLVPFLVSLSWAV